MTVPLDPHLAAADLRIQRSAELDHAESLVVLHDGDIVVERYYRGRRPEDLADTHSVTKSFTSAVVGILVSDGRLDLDMPVAPLLGPAFTGDPVKSDITVRHLLTMTSGLRGDGPWELCEVALSGRPWVETIFSAPLVSEPGGHYAYNNGAAHLLSAVIRGVAGMPVADFAADRLFAPLGIERFDWPADPQGHNSDSGHLRLAPRDMAKLGQLFLRRGTWDGRSVVAQDYVAAATSPQSPGGMPEWTSYGFLWWVDDLACPPAYFAAGHGGQYIYVVPEFDLVAVMTADAYAKARPYGRPLRNIIETYVVAAARSA